MTMSLTLNNQMRFQGNTMSAMKGILSGVLLNLVLAPLLIIYFCMGITGAAIATLISQTFGCLMLFLMSRRGQNIRIRLKDFTPNKQLAKEIIFGGTPSLSRQGLGSISTILLNVAAGAYGDAAIAGMSIVTRISFFTYAIVIGLGQGFQPLCGFCYGAHLYQRVKEAFYFCIKCGTVFLSVCALVGFAFSEFIIGLFRSDPDVIHVGAAALQTHPCQSCSSSQKRTFLHPTHLYIASFLWPAGRGNVSGLGRCMQLYHGHSYRLECFQGYEQIKENRRDSGGITQKLVKNKPQKVY